MAEHQLSILSIKQSLYRSQQTNRPLQPYFSPHTADYPFQAPSGWPTPSFISIKTESHYSILFHNSLIYRKYANSKVHRPAF